MLLKRIHGVCAEPRWLLVLGLSACLSAVTGCSDDPKSTIEPSTDDEDEGAGDDDDDDDDDDDGSSDDEEAPTDDDDDSPQAMRDGGTADSGGRDSGGGGRDSGAPQSGRDASSDAQVSPRPDSGAPRDSGPGGRDTGTPPAMSGSGCTPAPSGTFRTTSERGGPDGAYTIYRPVDLGEGGFKHPPIAWGNGVITDPGWYTELLSNLASHGFVVIADPGVVITASIVRQGLEWLIEQNEGAGEYAGNLAVDCAGTIGYSMGGGSAVGAGAHPAVKAVVSIHGLPDAAENARGPILLTTSEGDGFVTKGGFVEPCYTRSNTQPTILASHVGGDHLDPLGSGGPDAEPAIAWLRYWIYGDESQKDWFFGDNCTLCDWPDFRRKNHPEWR